MSLVPGKLRLLIVDDSPQMRRLLQSLLAEFASEIVEASSGVEAVRLYFAMRPDWVLMDVRMEGGDGIAATREILRGDSTARVVVLSQYDEPEIREAAAAAGAHAYVHKDNLLGLRKLIV